MFRRSGFSLTYQERAMSDSSSGNPSTLRHTPAQAGSRQSASGGSGQAQDRLQALELAIGQIEKQFGRGSIMRLGEASAHMAVEAIPNGSLALDIALGIGGVPRGRITEIFGP